MKGMHILLTNDDGFEAVGLQHLAQVLHSKYQVSIVAPDRQRSGASHSACYFQNDLLATWRKVPSINQAFMVTGTPADCVYVGLFGLLDRPVDVVISGINRGPNFASDVLYSGTIGGAMEALVLGYAAMAVSLNDYHADEACLYAHAAMRVMELLPRYMKDKRRTSYMLNVNVPKGMDRGICVMPSGGRRGYTRKMKKQVMENGQILLRVMSDPCINETCGLPVRDDQSAVEAGWCAVTPFRYGFAPGRKISILKRVLEEE